MLVLPGCCRLDADLSEDWMTASGDLKEGNLNLKVSDWHRVTMV